MTLSEALERYLNHTIEVRELSSPQTADLKASEEYRRVLLRNFARIGELAKENNDILQRYWEPLMRDEAPLSDETCRTLRTFAANIHNAYSLDNLDLSMRYRLATRLLADADKKGNQKEILRALDQHVEAAVSIMSMAARLAVAEMMFLYYRNEGLASGDRILSHLDHVSFLSLADDEEKSIVLINSRYISALFERKGTFNDPLINTTDLSFLERALSLCEDDFYRENAPSYNWIYHRFRTLQYIAQMNVAANIRGFDKKQLAFISECAKEMRALLEKHPDVLADAADRRLIDLHVARAAYLADETDRVAYKNELLRLYGLYDENDFSYFNTAMLLLVPRELFLLEKENGIREEDAPYPAAYYRQLISYIHRIPKKGALSYLLSYTTEIIEHFTEVPGGVDFETMCLKLMASLHPPTYVHSLSVTDFSVCLCRHLLRRLPELFTGVCGAKGAEEALAKEQEIIDYTRHAALLHDIGKLYVIEIIMTYGRTLFDEEFHMIKTHPLIGAYLLEQHKDTAKYAPVARFHHQWYDGSGGYPLDKRALGLPEKTIIDIVTCADCLDASTDAVGRSYKEGKTLDDYIREVHDGAGTRYAPYMAALLTDQKVRADIEDILSRGRDENYRKAYRILTAKEI